MPKFSAHDLAQLLHPQELEILEELAHEFSDDDSEESDAEDQVRLFSRDFIQLLTQAKQVHRGPKAKSKSKKKRSENWKKKSKKKKLRFLSLKTPWSI